MIKGKKIVIYGDYCESLDEKYYDYEEIDINNVFGIDSKILDYIAIPPIEFVEIFEQIYCKETNNLEDYITYKYSDIDAKKIDW